MNCIKSGLEKGDEAIPNNPNKAGRMRTLEKNGSIPEKLTQKTTELRAWRYDVQPCKKSQTISSGDPQDKSSVLSVFRGITKRQT